MGTDLPFASRAHHVRLSDYTGRHPFSAQPHLLTQNGHRTRSKSVPNYIEWRQDFSSDTAPSFDTEQPTEATLTPVAAIATTFATVAH